MASSTPADSLGFSLIGALALLGAAVLIGAGDSLLRPVVLKPDWSRNTGAAQPADAGDLPDSPDTETPADTPDQSAAAEPAEGPYIGLETARALFDEGALFIDAREPAEFEHAHILGAINLTAQMVSSGKAAATIAELTEGFGYDYPIVIYCHGGDCDASDNLAKLLLPMGFSNLRIMQAGFDEWQAAGFEVE